MAGIIGVASGVNQIRHYHPTVYVMDEASHLGEAQACYELANPVAWQIVAISTVAPGWFWNEVQSI